MELIDQKQLKERLKLGNGQLYILRKNGLPTIKIKGTIRFDWEAVQRWFKSHEGSNDSNRVD